MHLWLEWQSGYAAACKAVYPGSIPGSASNLDRKDGAYPCVRNPTDVNTARVVELVDTRDLKSLGFTAVTVRVRLRAPSIV